MLSINGVDVNGKYTAEGKEILEYLKDPSNYPVSIRFGRARLTSNEKLMLASMFHSYVQLIHIQDVMFSSQDMVNFETVVACCTFFIDR